LLSLISYNRSTKINMIQLLYIDPGSGSLLFQAILSGILTAVVFFKRIVAFLKFRFGRNENQEKPENINNEKGS